MSSKLRLSIPSTSIHPKINEDIELGDLHVRHDHESVPLVDDLRESFGLDDLPSSSKNPIHLRRKLIHRKRRCPYVTEKFQWLLSHILMLLGCYQAILIAWSLLDGLCPDDAKSVRAAFGLDNRYHEDTSSIPDSVFPISCHSHNDYWRVKPFYTAIEMGCSSIEADVWLDNGDLLVGHTKSSLSQDRTLQHTYLNPILETLDGHNPAGGRIGIFRSDPEQTLVLLIDFKVDGHDIWPILQSQLEPLRQKRYLTYFDGSSMVPGPITVVASGDVVFEDIVRNTTYRDIFYDAPLDVMGNKAPADLHKHPTPGHVSGKESRPRSRIPANPSIYSPINSYYASVSFQHSIGHPFHSSLTHVQIEKIRSQIHGAHSRGLKVRYWGVPSWPIGVRNYLWRVLVREGADVLSVDDVEAVTRGDWGPKKGGWERKWWP